MTTTTLDVPSDVVEDLANLRFTDRMNDRLHLLLDRNSEGTISDYEKEELNYLVELNETMSFFKARAMLSLGRRPSLR